MVYRLPPPNWYPYRTTSCALYSNYAGRTGPIDKSFRHITLKYAQFCTTNAVLFAFDVANRQDLGMSENVINPMTDARRQLNLRIHNDEIDPVQSGRITAALYFLDQHFPPKHLNKALIWLIDNNYIGRRFLAWYDLIAKASDLEMHRLLLSIVENDVLKPIIAGKNFKQWVQ